MNIAPTVELNSNKLLCDCVGVRQRGAEARGRVVFLEDQRWEVQVGRRASRLPVPNPQPDQIPGERRETPPLLPPPGKHWNLPAFLIIWLRFFLVQVTAARHFLFIYFGNKASQFWPVLFLTYTRLKSSSKPNTCHLSYRAVHPQIEFSLKLRKLASVKPPQVSEKQMVNAYFSSTFVVTVIFALYSLINHLHSLPRSYKKP